MQREILNEIYRDKFMGIASVIVKIHNNVNSEKTRRLFFFLSPTWVLCRLIQDHITEYQRHRNVMMSI